MKSGSTANNLGLLSGTKVSTGVVVGLKKTLEMEKIEPTKAHVRRLFSANRQLGHAPLST
jgi:hypothetical protein